MKYSYSKAAKVLLKRITNYFKIETLNDAVLISHHNKIPV